jgi:FkbM family methyltransferase
MKIKAIASSIWTKIRATKYIRFDLFFYHEKIAKIQGEQDLGRFNKIFYENFYTHCVNTLDAKQKVLIVDVGANDGWFAKVAKRFLKTEYKIICYEPLQEMKAHLDKLVDKSMKKIEYRPYGLGAANTSAVINLMGTSGLSSIKNIHDEYSYGNGFSQKILASYSIPIRKLDDESFGDEVYALKILKIDTQGYEIEVLTGAELAMSRRIFDYIFIEVMSLGKYEGSATYDKIIALLTGYGYMLFDIHSAYYEENGQCTEYDIIFKRT